MVKKSNLILFLKYKETSKLISHGTIILNMSYKNLLCLTRIYLDCRFKNLKIELCYIYFCFWKYNEFEKLLFPILLAHFEVLIKCIENFYVIDRK